MSTTCRSALLTISVLAVVLVPGSKIHAAAYDWDVPPGQSGDWSYPGSWGGTAPTSSDDAYVRNGGTANITQAGAACNNLYLGDSGAGRLGNVLMTDGSLTAANQYIGNAGDGTFTQSAGSNLVPAYGDLYLGYNSGTSGTYNLQGAGTLSAYYQCVGWNGAGTFNQSAGSNTFGGALLLGTNQLGSTGAYNLSGTGQLTGLKLSNLAVGVNGNGSFVQSDSSVNTCYYLQIGGNGYSNNGTYTLKDSAQLSAYQEYIGPGTFTQLGGTNTANAGSMTLGLVTNVPGTYNLVSGTLTANNALTVGYDGTGTFTQSGGTAIANYALNLAWDRGSQGTYNLNAGTLIAQGLRMGSGTAAFNFNGGTFQASSGFSSSVPMTLNAAVANIDTANNAVTLSGALSGPGGLNKLGSGTLTLTTTNTYAGPTTIGAGTLALGDNNSGAIGLLASPSIDVTSGATFDVSRDYYIYSVNGGQVLEGSGTVKGWTIVAAGGQISPGDAPGSAGTLSLTSNLWLYAGAVLDFDLAQPSASDQIAVASSLMLNGQQFSDFHFTPEAGFGCGTYTLITSQSVNGTLGGNLSGTIGGYSASLSTSGGNLLLTVVPEPSAIALLLASAACLLGYAWRRQRVRQFVSAAVVLLALTASVAYADVFNMPNGEASLQFVTVGDAGNAPDTAVMAAPDYTTGYGSVAYVYQIGKYDVTDAEYCQFLNAKAAASDPYGLWNSDMVSNVNSEGGITRSGSGPYTYAVKSGYANFPVVDVTWYDAVRFVNWLTNGQQSGDTESGTYTLTGSGPEWTVAVPSASQRLAWSAGGKTYYLLPSEDEWYKAAFYKGGGTNAGYWTYATQTDTSPSWELSTPAGPNPGTNSANFCNAAGDFAVTGSPVDDSGQNYLTDVGAYPASLSAYGTLDQAGDVCEWNEALLSSSHRGVRGNGWEYYYNVGWPESTNRSGGLDPSQEGPMFGFRVASVPEPSTLALLLAGAVALLACTWRRRASRKLLAVVSVVWFMGLAGAACAATPGQLLLSIPSPGPAYSGFGHGLSDSGNEIAIGAYGLTDVVFRYDASGEQLASYPSGLSSWAGFGASVAYDGDRIVGGGPFYEGTYTGMASVIDTTTGEIRQTNVGVFGDNYGWATALSDDYYAISAPGVNQVYVYDRQTDAQEYLLSSSGSFGISLAAEGENLLVGAPRAGAGQAGSVLLYDHASQTLVRTFTSPNPNDVNFGWSVAECNGEVLVGAPYAQAGGAAYLFDVGTGALLESFQNPAPATTGRFGWSVAFCGDSVLVGAPGNGAGSAPSGSAYAFRMDTGALEAELADPAPLANGEYGWAVASLDGQPVVSGHCNGVGTGDVYIFAIPEPSTIALLLAGAVGLLFWRRTRRLLGVVLVTMLAASVAQADAPIWGMEGGNPGRTNESSLLAPQTDIHKLWKVDLGANSFCQPAIGADGTIYVTNDLGQLIAVSPQGQKLWTFSGESIRASSPAIGNDGTIYFGTGEYGSNGGGPAYLYAVKPNGTELWQDSIGDNHPSAPLIDPQGRVLLGNENTCYCVNPNGSLAWSSSDASGEPALLPNGSCVMTDGYGTRYQCINSSGAAVWSTYYGYELEPPIVAGNGDLYAACYNATAWKIDPATGATLQTINTGLNAVASLSLDDDAQRLYLSDDSYLRSFDLNGNLLWSYPGTGGRSGPALIDAAGNLVSAEGQEGNGIDYISSSGNLLWRFAADEASFHFGMPTVGPGNVVYATNWTYNGSEGYLYAIVPEPCTIALLLASAACLLGYAWRRRVMKSLAFKQTAFFCVVVFGCAAVASAFSLLPGATTMQIYTGSQQDQLTIGFSETLIQNVGTLYPGGPPVNEIDVRLTSIGGTYGNGGAYPDGGDIPSTTMLDDIAGQWTFPGGVAYLPSTRANGSTAVNPAGFDGLCGDADYPGYWSGGGRSVVNLDSTAPGPGFAATGSGVGNNAYTFAATAINGDWYTLNSAYRIATSPVYQQGVSTFDNQLLAAFYVSPSTQYVQFYTTDGQPWNVNNSTGSYSQMGFNYDGARTDYVEITAPSPPPGNLVSNGGFETGDFAGWMAVAAPSVSRFGVYPSLPGISPHSGSFVAGFDAWGASEDTIAQSLATIPGQSYTITFWLAHDSTDNDNNFNASWNGTPLLALQNASAFGWTEYTFTETATSSLSTIQFGGRDNPPSYGWYGLDDISVAPVPEPAAIALLLASAACLLAFAWRRKSQVPTVIGQGAQIEAQAVTAPNGKFRPQTAAAGPWRPLPIGPCAAAWPGPMPHGNGRWPRRSVRGWPERYRGTALAACTRLAEAKAAYGLLSLWERSRGRGRRSCMKIGDSRLRRV